MMRHADVTLSSRRSQTILLVAVLVCVMLNPLNSSTISVALPVLIRVLHTNANGIAWIVSGFYLGSSIAQPIMGRLGDAWGRSRFVYLGLLIMILTAILAPMSHSLLMFVLWRVVQAIGTSMIYPNAIGLLRQHRPDDIGKILGWIGMCVGVAVAVGPSIGGFLIDYTSWHAIFWLNIPLAIIAMVALHWSVPGKTKLNQNTDMKASKEPIDWVGIPLFSTSVTLLLVWSNSANPFEWPMITSLVVGIGLIAALVLTEIRHAAPILPMQWFLIPQFRYSSMIAVLTNVVMYCILYGLPVTAEMTRDYTATQSGLLLLVFAGVMSIASPIGGRFAQSTQRRRPLFVAGILLAISTGMLILLPTLPLAALLLGLCILGMAFAIYNVVVQQIVLESVPAEVTGQASGVYTLLRYLGTMASSVLISGSVGDVPGVRRLFIIVTGVSFCCILLSLAIRNRNGGTFR